MFEAIGNMIKATFGLILVVLLLVFVAPAALAIWVFSAHGFWDSWGIALGSPAAFFWCGVLWCVVLAVFRRIEAVFPGAIAVIAALLWLSLPAKPSSDATLLHHTPSEVTVTSTCFSPDGRTAIFGDCAGNLMLYDTRRWEEIRRYQVKNHVVSAASFSPDGRRVVIGTGGSRPSDDPDGGFVIVYPLDSPADWKLALARQVSHTKTETPQEHTLTKGRFGEVKAVRFSPDGKRILAVGYWNTVFGVDTFDAETGTKTASLTWGGKDIRALTLSDDCKRLLLLVGKESDRRSVWLWDVETQPAPAQLPLQIPEDDYRAIGLHPNGRYALVCGEGSRDVVRLVVWDLLTGKQSDRIEGEKGERYAVVRGDSSKQVGILDLRRNRMLRFIDASDNVPDIFDLAISPDGRFVATGSVWSMDLWKLR